MSELETKEQRLEEEQIEAEIGLLRVWQNNLNEALRRQRESLIRWTLQKKYLLTFSSIFLIILIYIIFALFAAEKEELIRLSEKNFMTTFQTMNSIGAEALSTGDQDKLVLRAFVREVFNSKLEGLQEIFFLDAERRFFVYQNANREEIADTVVASDSLWHALETQSGNIKVEVGNKIYLTKKLFYEASGQNIFVGYSRLLFTIDHINELIERKQEQTLLIGATGFLVSLIVLSIVTALFVKRIQILNEGTKQVIQGIFEPLPVRGSDEISELTDSFNKMMVAVKERLMMSRYVSQSTLGMIRKVGANEMAQEGMKEEICVLFSDVRGFTAFAELNEPQHVVARLNRLLNLQVEIIKRYGGDIDKFVGDEVMAIFRGSAKEQRAVAAAIAIQEKLQPIFKAEEGQSRLRIGIGINTGVAVMGNIGSAERMDFTAIGDVVNTAARLCSVAKADEILVAEEVINSLPKGSVNLSEPFTLLLKNKLYAVTIYRVLYDTVD
jgi:class 3 adenylate cyclase